MASNQDLLRIWKELGKTPPLSALLINENKGKKEVLLVVSDKDNILTLITPRGEIVYLGKQRCKLEEGMYSCKEHLYTSPCLIPNPLIEFVKKEIFPLYYYKNTL